MKQFQKLLATALMFAVVGASVFADLSEDYAKDSAALRKLRAGTVVALYSNAHKKYLEISPGAGNDKAYRFLKATGDNKNNVMCQFQVVRHSAQPNWIFFKSLQNVGKNLQFEASSPYSRIARFENHNRGTWEKFALEVAADDSLDNVKLRNFATETYLCISNHYEGRAAGNREPHGGGRAEDAASLKIEIVKEVGATDHPGGHEFTYRRAMRDDAHVAFSDKWKFKNPKKGVVKFKAKAPLDVYVSFSPAPNWAGNQTYTAIIGAWSNTRSVICYGWINELAKRELASGALDSDMLTGGWGADAMRLHIHKIKADGLDWEKDGSYKGTAWDHYWVSYEVDAGKVTIAWGKGEVAYKNERSRAVHPNATLSGFEYFGLGGYFLDVEYKDIQVDDEGDISQVAGLDKIEGIAHRVALGAHEGKYLAMMIGQADRKLYKMDSKTMGGWDLVEVKDGDAAPAKFEDVSVANDGTVGVLADDGTLFLSHHGGTKWHNLGAPKGEDGKAIDMDRVAVASRDLVAILDKETSDIFVYVRDGEAHKDHKGGKKPKGGKKAKGDKGAKDSKNADHHKDGEEYHARGHWERRAHGHAMSIAAGHPNILLAINKKLDVYRLVGNDWVEFPNPNNVGRFAIIDEDDMYGTVEKDHQYHLYKCTAGTWAPVLDVAKNPVVGIKEVVVNAAGALLAMNIKGELLKQGVLDLPVTLSAAKAAVASGAKKAGKGKKMVVKGAGKKGKMVDANNDGKDDRDTDGDGKVSKAEAAAYKKAHPKHKAAKKGAGKKGKMVDADHDGRDDRDADGDGKVSKEEAAAYKKAHPKHKASKKGAGKKDKMVDANHDGKDDRDANHDGVVDKAEKAAAKTKGKAAKAA